VSDPKGTVGKSTPLTRPRGTRDLLPLEMRRRRFVESRFRDIAELWGYCEVATPAFEPLELFTLKSGEAIVDELYSFTDKGGRSLALRPELTAPVARLYVNELQLPPSQSSSIILAIASVMNGHNRGDTVNSGSSESSL